MQPSSDVMMIKIQCHSFQVPKHPSRRRGGKPCNCEYHRFMGRKKSFTLLVHSTEPIPIIKKKIASLKQCSWSDIRLHTYAESFGQSRQKLLNNTSLDEYGVADGDILQASVGCSLEPKTREQLIQIGEGQYMKHPGFTSSYKKSVTGLKKWICKTLEDQALYKVIKFESLYETQWECLLEKTKTNVWSIWDDEKIMMVLCVKIKGTNQWLVDYKVDKLDKLCDGYCRKIEKENSLNLPVYLKQIVRSYHPKSIPDDSCLFHHPDGL